MGISFNLIEEPWIGGVLLDGAPCELSLAQVFARAREVREIFDESPLVTVAVHRLLLAILHRNFGPSGPARWGRLWREGWDAGVLEHYFSRWRARFDLFDPARPFFQVPELAGTARQPVATLFEELASGNNPTLFDHSYRDERRRVSFAAAARGVVARQAFSLGFGKNKPFYFSDSALIRGYNLLLYGANLFETLMLNLLGYGPDLPLAGSGGNADLPIWEQERPAAPKKAGSAPLGYVDYLTWQSRRIHLYPEPDGGGVRWCQLRQNLKLSEEFALRDPLKSYREDKERGLVARSFREERGFWRDSAVLLDGAAQSPPRPKLIDWLATLATGDEFELLPPAPELRAFGLATAPGKSASVTFWREARIAVPLVYLREQKLFETLSLALGCAEESARELRQAGWAFARTYLEPPGEVKLDERTRARREDVAPLAAGLAVERRFWPVLEREIAIWMRDLAVAPPAVRDARLTEWRGLVRRAAGDALHAALSDIDCAARALRAGVIAERLLATRLGPAPERAPHAGRLRAKSLEVVEFLSERCARPDWLRFAILRAGSGDSAQARGAALRVLEPIVGSAAQGRKDDAGLLAALMAIYPQRWRLVVGEGRGGYNFGSSMLSMKSRRRAHSETEPRRFAALLMASRAELGAHLRHAVAGFAPYNVMVDWMQLLDDLADWELAGRPVQRRWARAYWAGVPADEAVAAAVGASVAEPGGV